MRHTAKRLAPIPRSALTRPGFAGEVFFFDLSVPMASTDWSNDCPRRDASQLALVTKLSGDLVTIRPGWAADYAMLLVACLPGG